jgi:hypothetical protein
MGLLASSALCQPCSSCGVWRREGMLVSVRSCAVGCSALTLPSHHAAVFSFPRVVAGSTCRTPNSSSSCTLSTQRLAWVSLPSLHSPTTTPPALGSWAAGSGRSGAAGWQLWASLSAAASWTPCLTSTGCPRQARQQHEPRNSISLWFAPNNNHSVATGGMHAWL